MCVLDREHYIKKFNISLYATILFDIALMRIKGKKFRTIAVKQIAPLFFVLSLLAFFSHSRIPPSRPSVARARSLFVRCCRQRRRRNCSENRISKI